jgi:hypothetical protein
VEEGKREWGSGNGNGMDETRWVGWVAEVQGGIAREADHMPCILPIFDRHREVRPRAVQRATLPQDGT